jgi:hypothetical protein
VCTGYRNITWHLYSVKLSYVNSMLRLFLHESYRIRFKILTAVIMQVALFWNVKAYRAVGRYKVLPPNFTLQMEAASNGEMLLPLYQYTRCHKISKNSWKLYNLTTP